MIGRLRSVGLIAGIATAGPAPWVEANLADFENGAIRPAQLVIMRDAVPDTLTLNQIL